MIASENYPSQAVLDALTSPFAFKYAEGYPGKRYYGGCNVADELEEYAREAACDLFEADHANVQPHSGTQANMAVYHALLKPGDTVLALGLNDGGHLSHGSPASFSGKNYKVKYYHVHKQEDGTYEIDMDEVRYLAAIYRPKLIIAGGSSLQGQINYDEFKNIAMLYNAYFMVDIAHNAGPIVAEIVSNPMRYADVVTSTTQKTLRGPRGGLILCKRYLKDKIDKAVFPGVQGGPHMNTIAAKAVAFDEASDVPFEYYQDTVCNATTAFGKAIMGVDYVPLQDMPHMCIINTKERYGLTGAEAQAMLEDAGIIVNKQMLPDDTESPAVTSGIRVGFAAAITRDHGFDASETGRVVDEILKSGVKNRHRDFVRWYTRDYPLYGPNGYYKEN